ncbi:cytochrome P450 [Streptomyces sp. NPDC002564]|uniref:cytochrome P450 n=1 Tax=Streptomyces sp. NPDC002564 TaxID=3364649 RepID=UPI003691D424
MARECDFVHGKPPVPHSPAGHAVALARHPLQFMGALHQFGDLVEVQLGPQAVFVPCHPELIWRVLSDPRTFDKGGIMFDGLRRFVGHSLVTCPYEDHHRQRSLLQPAFQHSSLRAYGQIMEEEITALCDSWRPGQVIDALPTFARMALNIVSRSLFNRTIDARSLTTLQQDFELGNTGIILQTLLPAAVRHLPLPVVRRYAQAQRRARAFASRMVTESRNAPEPRTGLLAVLDVQASGTGRRPSDVDLRDQVITMLMGGSDTIPTTLAWCTHVLARRPDLWHRLQEETDQHPTGTTARWGDLPQLRLTDRVLTETLRTHPPAWLTTREVTRDTTMAGHPLPAGSTIALSAPAVHRRASLYPDPLRFDPDRWLPGRAAALPPGAFLAFGGGNRKCIGDTFGFNEMSLALATIAARWNLVRAAGSDPRPVTLSGVYRPRRILLRVEPRD